MSGEMVPYVVRQGDYLVRLGWIHGFDPEEVWNDPKNEELKKLRGDHNILAPGDVVYIPAKQKEGLPIEKGATNRYVAKVPKVKMKVCFRDAMGPMANARFEIEGDAAPSEGTTDADGYIELNIPATTAEIHLRFPDREQTYTLLVGHLDPIENSSGIEARLRHLGYLVPHASELFDVEMPHLDGDDHAERVAFAVRAFQQDQGIEATGIVDEATRSALKRAHGV